MNQTKNPQGPVPTEQFLSRRVLCNRWEVSIDFLRNLEEHGVLNPLKLSARCLRYRLSEIEAIERQPNRIAMK